MSKIIFAEKIDAIFHRRTNRKILLNRSTESSKLFYFRFNNHLTNVSPCDAFLYNFFMHFYTNIIF